MNSIAERLIAIVDLQQITARDQRVEQVIERALQAGVINFLLRTKNASAEAVKSISWEGVLKTIQAEGARAIVHDSLFRAKPDLGPQVECQHWSMAYAQRQAEEQNRSAVLDEKSLNAPTSTVCSTHRFGVSVHDLSELRVATSLGASWAFVSPWAVSSSKSHDGPVLGKEGTRAFASASSLPLFVLGGVNAQSIVGISRCAVAGCVVMGLLTNPQATLEIKALLHQMENETWANRIPW